MKNSQHMDALMIGLVLAAFSTALGQSYGPNGCVSINRSQQGTCVIATNCQDGVNLDKLEFAFDCETKAQIQKHSFGVGGFDLVEEFDTGIKCAQCKVPEIHKVHKVTKNSGVHMFAKGRAAKENALVDKYGPGECVEAYRSTTGTCMIRTQCKGQDISNYDFGLLCVHNVTSGENVRHLFGKNSFDPEEEFDTLIKCEKCLGLRAEASQAAATAVDANVKSEDLVKKVNTLVDEVGAMQTGLEKIKDDVKVLNEKVPKLYTGEAKEEESKEGESKDEEKKEGEAKDEKTEEKKDEDAKEGETEEKKTELLLSHHRSKRHTRQKLHQKLQQKHHRKKHRSNDEDEDKDEDKEDDEGSDDSSSSRKDSRDQDDAQDEDDSKDQDQDQEDSDDKKVDDDAKDSEEAN